MKELCLPIEVMKQYLGELRDHHEFAKAYHGHCLDKLNEIETKYGLNKQKNIVFLMSQKPKGFCSKQKARLKK